MSSSKLLYDELTKLVSFQTVSGDLENTNQCFSYLEQRLSSGGLDTHLLRSSGFPSIFATTQPGTRAPKLILQAHMDVVPAQKNSFTVTEKDGRLYGRGVFDMKFAAACYLLLADELKDELAMYDFGIMLTADEEIGGENGVGYLLAEGYSCQVCLLPDGGENWEIESTCNGVWMIRLVASGVSAHGSRPWEGENAISLLVESLDEIKGLFGEVAAGCSSITISQIHGGTAINQVPDSAEATIDMRFVSQDDFDTYTNAIRLIASNRGLQLDVVASSPCGLVDMQNPHVIDFLTVAERVHGKPIGKNHSLGASDARFFAERSIPTIVTRPAGGGHHSNNEWIDKADFMKFYELVKAYVVETSRLNA